VKNSLNVCVGQDDDVMEGEVVVSATYMGVKGN